MIFFWLPRVTLVTFLKFSVVLKTLKKILQTSAKEELRWTKSLKIDPLLNESGKLDYKETQIPEINS